MSISATENTAIPVAIESLREQWSNMSVGEKGSHGALQLRDYKPLTDKLLNRASLLLIKTPEFHGLSAASLTYALEPITELLRDGVTAQIEHALQSGQTIPTEAALTQAATQITAMLDAKHPFVTHNLIPRALYHEAAHHSPPRDMLVELAGYCLEKHATLFAGLPDSLQRAKAVVTLIEAMGKTHDDRNPFPNLSDETKLMVIQRALTVASSPSVPADRVKDFLRPYGTLMHRLIGQSLKPVARHYSLPHTHRFSPEGTAADQAVRQFMSEVRSTPHYRNEALEEVDIHTLGSDFSAQCDRLESSLRLLLDHPDLKPFNAQTLYRALDPIHEALRSSIEAARHATQNPAVEAGKHPFLIPQQVDAIVGHLQQRFTDPAQFFASAGIVMHAQLMHDLTAHSYKVSHRLDTALNNIMDYTISNQDALLARRKGTIPPETDHKLELLDTLQESLSFLDTDSRLLRTLPPEIRGRIFIDAVRQATTSIDSQADWKTILADTNPQWKELAANCKRYGRPSELAEQEHSEAQRERPVPTVAPIASDLPTVVPIRGGNSLTDNRRRKFEERIGRHNGARPDVEAAPSQDALEGSGPTVVSFADRLKAKQAAESETHRTK